jgi:hypothetical protein
VERGLGGGARARLQRRGRQGRWSGDEERGAGNVCREPGRRHLEAALESRCWRCRGTRRTFLHFSASFLLAALRVFWLRFLWRGVTILPIVFLPPFLFSHSHHSLVQTLLCIRALSPLPVTLFYFRSFPTLPCPRAIPFRSVLFFFSFLSVGGVPISSGSGNPSATNHRGCFAPSANRGRASVSRKGDAGPISPRIRRGALLILAGAFRSGHSLPGGRGGGRWSRCTSPPSPQAAQFTGGQI